LKPEVSVLIPAYNEAERIAATIQAVKKIPLVAEVIVVDDGSQDNTAQVSKKAGAEVIVSEANQGKGAALNLGVKQLTSDLILLLDADLEASASKADRLLAPILAGDSDMVIAQFSAGSGEGGFGLAKKLARYGLEWLTGQQFKAPLSGQRAVKKKVLTEVGKFAPNFGAEVALTIDVWRAGYKIKEVPIAMEHRTTGRNAAGFYHRGRQFKDILTILVSKWGSGS